MDEKRQCKWRPTYLRMVVSRGEKPKLHGGNLFRPQVKRRTPTRKDAEEEIRWDEV